MPELPEVETSRRGIEPYLKHRNIDRLVVRERRLRWPIPADLEAQVAGQRIKQVSRRAKYILIDTDPGSLILHLGMSGSLKMVKAEQVKPAKHDHFDLMLNTGYSLRYHDPRRFGCLLWMPAATAHPLLADLGPEPLSDDFNATYLYRQARGRKMAIKGFVMNQQFVVGVGNIYASEALHKAGISPRRAAGAISLKRMQKLVTAIKAVLRQAIKAGGTTLKDFTDSQGKAGYFKQSLFVYDRESQPCLSCDSGVIQKMITGQRATYYCNKCQRY